MARMMSTFVNPSPGPPPSQVPSPHDLVSHRSLTPSGTVFSSRNKRDRAHLENLTDEEHASTSEMLSTSPQAHFPEKKLSRSLQTDMEQLSLANESESDSEFSMTSLPPVPGRSVPSDEQQSILWDIPPSTNRQSHNSSPSCDMPDQDTQYINDSDPDGGAVD